VSQSGVADSTVSNRVNYRQQTVSCVGGSTWWQYSLYDMLTDFSYSGHVNYATCSPRSAGTAWATSTAKNTTWSAGVSFPGIGASAQSGYGTSQQMTYHFTSSGSICGNSTSGPLSSSQVSAHA
jgi:hypothetical protein